MRTLHVMNVSALSLELKLLLKLAAKVHLCTLIISPFLQGFPGDIGPPGENGPEGLKVSGAEIGAMCGVGSSQGKQSSGKGGERESPGGS